MEHQQAMDLKATEKYFLGELSEGQRDEFEEHFFTCGECADDVRATSSFLGAARDALRPGLAQPDLTAGAGPPAAARKLLPWPTSRFRVQAFSGLAALLCIAVYPWAFEIPRLKDELQQARALRIVPSSFLPLSRGEPPVVVVTARDPFVALTVSQGWERPGAPFRCQVKDAQGRVVLDRLLPSTPSDEELQILLPVADLAPGRYDLVLEGVPAEASPPSAAPPTARYPFILQRQ